MSNQYLELLSNLWQEFCSQSPGDCGFLFGFHFRIPLINENILDKNHFSRAHLRQIGSNYK